MSTPLPPNEFKTALRDRRRLIGCWCALGGLVSTEVLGLAGFDWLLLDTEHAPNDVLTLVPQLLSLRGTASAPVVRPSDNDAVQIKKLLDAGFVNFLVPMVSSGDDARAAVAATRYPPAGVRGVSVSHRGNGYGGVDGYYNGINAQVCVMVQIETAQAVQALAEIAAVDGVDALFIGPSDLAAALGHVGHSSHPDVQAVIEQAIRTGLALGKAVGILAPAEADARRYLQLGATVVAVGSDLGLLRQSSRALADKFIDTQESEVK